MDKQSDGVQPLELLDSEQAQQLRSLMVLLQLRGRGIIDPRVLAVMGTVPRQWFCPQGTPEAEAYGDYPLPIGWGQTISQPLMVAEMLEQLRLTGNETVLEIGTGSGYNAALLSGLARKVFSLEIIPELAMRAQKLLQCGNFGNVEVIVADGSLGWPPASPYDAIVVTAGAPVVPAALKTQLQIGGRLVIPVGAMDLQKLIVLHRTETEFLMSEYGGCRFVPLQGQYGWH